MVKIMDGIDVSAYQGHIDWKKVEASGVKVAIIKAGERYTKHGRFEEYYRNVKTASNIKIGAYWFSRATSVYEAKEEAQACIRALTGKQFEFPIYFDVETEGAFKSGHINEIITAFCSELENAGYYPGVYCSTFWYTNYVKEEVRKRYPAWIADYRGKCYYKNEYGMWQYDAAPIPGIEYECDRNEVYTDYSDYIKHRGLNGFKISASTAKKSTAEIVQEILNGLWGNGTDRRNRLTQAGYDYETIQKSVNAIVYAPKKTVIELAKEVIAGKWSAGDERYRLLTEAGYDYYRVQRKVNEILCDKE